MVEYSEVNVKYVKLSDRQLKQLKTVVKKKKKRKENRNNSENEFENA